MPRQRPGATECPEYYFTYISQVPDGDIRTYLASQAAEVEGLLEAVSEERSRHRYAEGKWSIREAVAHLNDCERLFVFRAFWFARDLGGVLPSFDQEIANTNSGAEARSLKDHLDEFRHLRASTLQLVGGLPEDAWGRSGLASGLPFTVRSLAWTAAGHVTHHLRILRERYLQPA
jgi:hypothetical protein